MKATPLTIPDVLLLEPRVFEDERGFFYESYNQQAFDEAVGHPVTFVQDNHSRSVKGTLRGLHYQLPPHPQGKLVRVTLGAVFDVAVDIRRGNGWGKRSPPKTADSYGFHPASPMAFWSPATSPSSSTSAPISTHPPASEASAGTTPTWASTGPSTATR